MSLINAKNSIQVYNEIRKYFMKMRSEEVPRIVQMIEFESLERTMSFIKSRIAAQEVPKFTGLKIASQSLA